MTEQLEKRIIFSDEAETTFIDIIRKYNLEETDEEMERQWEQDLPSKKVILDQFAKDVADKKIKKENYADYLAGALSVPRDMAQNIANEIENKVVPLLEKFSEPELTETIKESDTFPKIKPPIEVEEALERVENAKEESFKKIDIPKKSFEKSKKIKEEKNIPTSQPKEQNTHDTYREPIG